MPVPKNIIETLSPLQRDIKAINERVAQAARDFGRNSEIYKNMERAIEKLVPESLIDKSGAGNIRIKQGFNQLAKEYEKNADFLNTSDVKKQMSSSGQYRKKTREEYREEYGKGNPTNEELREFSEMKQRVKNAAEDGRIKNILSEGGAKGTKRNRRLTYEELDKLVADYDASLELEEKARLANDFVKNHFYGGEDWEELKNFDFDDEFF